MISALSEIEKKVCSAFVGVGDREGVKVDTRGRVSFIFGTQKRRTPGWGTERFQSSNIFR